MFKLTFWTDLAERTLRTFAQAFLAVLAVTWKDAGSWDQIDWSTIWQTGVYAGVLAVLFALVGKQIGDSSTASVLKE